MHYFILIAPTEEFENSPLAVEEFELPANKAKAIQHAKKLANKKRFRMPNGKTCHGVPLLLESKGIKDEVAKIVRGW
ncbi:MAG: hypothetical protein A3A98_03015 [Candidatus Staskawiczbacteria bacterium RIFCSPLOWO2_01_FULL_40_39]|uniref:Uncharacterized protein n=1 Tax=Candidatus Staskawiczbacteria bacterium RIFCSPHIGHO2_01_FULL_39_25 TaxID=1802202 RepID=A0A1G2HPT5_9BACT|nr:MAG: hypothetical protein A2730_01480 [Candidatus Staskawiczbacteria bacterium RIFCSPHIGHO2_01_FULL_39_25]OGZ73858.1 MAG: hypothetical protein A3A98_03015 [Candidatus Staskawiczbacteria bacterium RIFCSPLOWO2_01_FULL_40_39]OGZ75896.1 MAG: hypothetical protein A3I87_00045 [Candidatus Staskawiczbacteria bacterium RIFCSPLOWO2_02_FULL_39_8]